MDSQTTQTIAIVAATILSPIIPTIISVIFFIKNRKYEIRKLIEDRLFKIQQLAFEYPYVEDEYFIKGWNEFVMQYRRGEVIEEEKVRKFLQYEQYCEMIFNLLELVVIFYKTEQKILQFIDFKSWVKTHREWWNKPLDNHSNYDTYNNKVIKLVVKWLKTVNDR